MLVVAGVGLASIPWWLGVVLRPVLKAQGVTFNRYERMGYAQFRLLGVHFSRPGFNLIVAQVQAPAPLVWIEQRLRGAEPAVTADGWQLQRTTPESSPAEKKTLNGLPDLQRRPGASVRN